jgi:hypothetical protein
MAESKKSKKASDAGQSEVQKIVDQGQEQGYTGIKIDQLPNSAHSLESGPDAPTAAEQRDALKNEEG